MKAPSNVGRVGACRYVRVVQGMASIDLVGAEVGAERAALLTHFDAVDTKAGLVLGFAGAIAALSARPIGPWSGAGLAAATVSGLRALVSFWPRRYWRTDLDALRRKYLASDPAFARIGLLDSQILMATRHYAALRWKVLFLKFAMLSLAIAVPLSALGTTLE